MLRDFPDRCSDVVKGVELDWFTDPKPMRQLFSDVKNSVNFNLFAHVWESGQFANFHERNACLAFNDFEAVFVHVLHIFSH
jgi:hypothetical protein